MNKIVGNLFLIAAVDKNWAIGNEDGLLFSIPADLQLNFKAKTTGQIVIMGRGTFESLPGKKPLAHRMNIVLSRSMDTVDHKNMIVCKSLTGLWAVLENNPERQAYVAGGASVYKQLLPYCSLAFITKVLAVRKADRYMEDLDANKDWELAAQGPVQIYGEGLRFFFTKYRRKQVAAENIYC